MGNVMNHVKPRSYIISKKRRKIYFLRKRKTFYILKANPDKDLEGQQIKAIGTVFITTTLIFYENFGVFFFGI